MKPLVIFDDPFINHPWPGLVWQVQSLSWFLPGGAAEARLEAVLPVGVSADWLARLGSVLVITTPAGDALWGGTIETIHVYQESGCRRLSMADVVNRVKVRYQRTGFSGPEGMPWLETEWMENTRSLARFGKRELLLDLGQSSAPQAAAAGENILRKRAFPSDLPLLNENSQPPRLVLTCKGWWSGLEWQMDEEPTGRICHLVGGKSHLVLGSETTNSKLAQSFVTPAEGFTLGEVYFRLALAAAPLDDVILEVYDDGNNQPGTLLASVVLPAGELNGAWNWVRWLINPPLVLAADAVYWLVLRRSGGLDPVNYYKVESDDGPGFADGVCKRWSGSEWVTVGEDLRFTCLAVSPLPALMRSLVLPLQDGSRLSTVRINLPDLVQTFRWRSLALTKKKRLCEWLDLAAAPGRPVSAVVNFQRALDVFPLPRLPHQPLQMNRMGEWLDPNGADGRLGTVPVGRLVVFQRRQWVVMAAEWTPLRGFVMTSLQEISPTLQD